MSYYILQEKQNERQQIVIIHLDEEEVVVGREHFSSLRDFFRVSRRHAKFLKGSKGELFVKDLKSRNGLYVNFKKVGSALCLLKAGDQIGFGSPDIRADNKAFICVLLKKPKVQTVDNCLTRICTTLSLVSSDSEIDAATTVCAESEKDTHGDSFLNTVDHSLDSVSLPDVSVPVKSINTFSNADVMNESCSKYPVLSNFTKASSVKSEELNKPTNMDNVKKTSQRALSVLKECQKISKIEGPKNAKKLPTSNSPNCVQKTRTSSKKCETSFFERNGLLSDSSADSDEENQQTYNYRKVCVKNKRMIYDEVVDDEELRENLRAFKRSQQITKQTIETSLESPQNLNPSRNYTSDFKGNHEPTDNRIIHRALSSVATTCITDSVNFPSDSEHSEASIASEKKIIIPFFGKNSVMKLDMASKDKCHNWNSKKTFVSEWIVKHQHIGSEVSENQKCDMIAKNPDVINKVNSMDSLEESSKTNNEGSPNEKVHNTAEFCLEQDDSSNSDISSLKSGDRVMYPSKSFESNKIRTEVPEVNVRESDRNANISNCIQGQTFNSCNKKFANRIKDPRSSQISNETESEVMKTYNETKPSRSKRKNTLCKRKRYNSNQEGNPKAMKVAKITEYDFKKRATVYSQVQSYSQPEAGHSTDKHEVQNRVSLRLTGKAKVHDNFLSSKSPQVPKEDSRLQQQLIFQKSADLLTTQNSVSESFQKGQTENTFATRQVLERNMNATECCILLDIADIPSSEINLAQSKVSDFSAGNKATSLHYCEQSTRDIAVIKYPQDTLISKGTVASSSGENHGNLECPERKSIQIINSLESCAIPDENNLVNPELKALRNKKIIESRKESKPLESCYSKEMSILNPVLPLANLQGSSAENRDSSKITSQPGQHLPEFSTTQSKLSKPKFAHSKNLRESLSYNTLKRSSETQDRSKMENSCSRSSHGPKSSPLNAHFPGNNLNEVSSCGKSLISKGNEIKYEYSKKRNVINDMIKKIVHWNCMWLKEQRRNPYLPKAISNCIRNLPLQFKSFDLYMASLSSVLTLEIWEILYQRSKLIFESNFIRNKFEFCVLELSKQNDIVIFTCELFVNDIVAQCPQNGSTIFIRIPRTQPASYALGYIFKRERAENNSSICLSEWRKQSSIMLAKSELWVIKICAKQSLELPEKSLIEANIVCNLYDKVALFDRIQELRSSIFLEDILVPKYKVFCTEPVPTETTARESGDCSLCQRLIIERIVSDITKFPQVPRISLIEGLPGTGKTHIIIRILENLIFGRKLDKKVLVIVPSFSSLDEINRRMIEINELNAWRDTKLKFERLGLSEETYLTLRTFSEKAEVNSEGIKKNFEVFNSGDKNSYSDEENVFNGPSKNSGKTKEKYSEKRKNYNHHDSFTDEIFENTDILLSTLSDFSKYISVPRLKCIFEKRFSLCIVDESTQCTEPEILGLFTLNITKVILVGDHKELTPSLSSHYAFRCGLGRSLFERFKDNFTQSPYEYPVHTLTEQFRMHPQICNFPSRHFYDGRLVTTPDIEMLYDNCPLRPYTVVDVLGTSDSEIDERGASLIASFCSEAIQATSSISVGIMTPDELQKKHCFQALPENLRKIVKVNTVEKFQGQERDIMIISCFFSNRSFKKSFHDDRKKLNVALTRARLCLIIIGQISSLISQVDWKDLISNANSRKHFVRVSFNDDIKSVFHKCLFKK